MSGWTVRRPPHIRRTRAQERALVRAVDRMVTLRGSERAVLNVLVAHSDGGGYCFLNITATIVPESGYSYRAVHLALGELQKAGLVEVFKFKRTPVELPKHLPRRAKQGQGPSTYRLGAILRDAAQLRDHDPNVWSDPPPDAGERLDCTPEIEPEIEQANNGRTAHPASCTPESPSSLCNPGCATAAQDANGCTPITGNHKPLSKERLTVREGEDPGATDRLLAALGYGEGGWGT